jgi:hypothetical protein
MADLPDNVDLQWIARTLLAIQAEQAAMRADMAAIRQDMGLIKGELAGFTHRFAAMDGRLTHLQTIGTWLIAGLMGSYAAILAVALRIPHP